jgi:hypothetical protein
MIVNFEQTHVQRLDAEEEFQITLQVIKGEIGEECD